MSGWLFLFRLLVLLVFLGRLFSSAYFCECLINGYFNGFDLVLEKLDLSEEELELEGETVEAHGYPEAVAREIPGFYGLGFAEAAAGCL